MCVCVWFRGDADAGGEGRVYLCVCVCVLLWPVSVRWRPRVACQVREWGLYRFYRFRCLRLSVCLRASMPGLCLGEKAPGAVVSFFFKEVITQEGESGPRCVHVFVG